MHWDDNFVELKTGEFIALQLNEISTSCIGEAGWFVKAQPLIDRDEQQSSAEGWTSNVTIHPLAPPDAADDPRHLVLGACNDVGTPQLRRQQVVAAEHIERQVAVGVVVAVEEPAFLAAVERIVGGVQIEDDPPPAATLPYPILDPDAPLIVRNAG